MRMNGNGIQDLEKTARERGITFTVIPTGGAIGIPFKWKIKAELSIGVVCGEDADLDVACFWLSREITATIEA